MAFADAPLVRVCQGRAATAGIARVSHRRQLGHAVSQAHQSAAKGPQSILQIYSFVGVGRICKKEEFLLRAGT